MVLVVMTVTPSGKTLAARTAMTYMTSCAYGIAYAEGRNGERGIHGPGEPDSTKLGRGVRSRPAGAHRDHRQGAPAARVDGVRRVPATQGARPPRLSYRRPARRPRGPARSRPGRAVESEHD